MDNTNAKPPQEDTETTNDQGTSLETPPTEAVDTPQTNAATESSTSQPDKPPRNSRKRLVVLTIVLALALAGVGAWIMFGKDKSATAPAVTEAPTDTAFDPATKFPGYIEQLQSKYTSAITDSTVYTGEENGGLLVYSDTISEFVYLQSPDSWSGVLDIKTETEATTQDSDVYDELVALIRADGLEDYKASKVYKGPFSDDGPEAYLVRDDVLCHVDTFVNGEFSYQLQYSCAKPSELSAAATEIQPFYDAYYAKNPETKDSQEDFVVTIDMSTLETTADFAQYETVEGGTPGAYLRFYRINGGEWVFGYGGNGMPSCTDFAGDVDVQKAFADNTCVDEASPADPPTLKQYFNL